MDFFYDIKKLEDTLNPIYTKLRERVSASSHADRHYSGMVDVTEIVKPFTRIILDDSYKLIAYSSYDIHGTFGEIVAIEKDKETPEAYLKHEFTFFQRIIPDVCYPVSEVIFCDGTPEGFFEVILLKNVLWKLFRGYTKTFLTEYYFSLDDLDKELLFKPLDYAPKFYESNAGASKLLILERTSFDNAIYLCEYEFSNWNPRRWQTDKKYSHIEFKTGRFTKDKSCCYFSRKSVCVSDGEKDDLWI